MAYTVSQDFKEKIKDETALKSCLVLFDDLFFSTADFTDSGVEFNQYFNTSDDLTFGDCPSDTLSFAVIANGKLSGYSFGKCRAYLGVQTASSAYAFGDINAHIEVGGYTWTASSTGLYCDGTLIDSGEYVSLVSDGIKVYAVGTSSSYSADIDGSNGAEYLPHAFMAQKLRSGLSAVFEENTAQVWDGENVITIEYVPMGQYNVVKPRSTVGDIVEIQDAYDNMNLFDADASQFLESLTYPITLSGIYTALCDFVGVEYVTDTFLYSDTPYTSSPFADTSCSLRDILWWIAERARAVAHCDREGLMDLIQIGSSSVESLTASDIGQDGYSVAEYKTPEVTGVLLRSGNGTTLSFGSMTAPYMISANPFISTITNEDLEAYESIPTYIPMEIMVLEADPSVDMGDMIDVRPMVDEILALTNVYDEIYSENDEALSIEAPTYQIPLMNRTLTFTGGIRASYTATGNEIREADLSNTEYNASVAPVTQTDVFNRLTNGGEQQGIYLEDGKIYINGEYIKANSISADLIYGGTLSGASINIGNGTFRVDSNGKVNASDMSINGGSLHVTASSYNEGRVSVQYARAYSTYTDTYTDEMSPAFLNLSYRRVYTNGTVSNPYVSLSTDGIIFGNGGTEYGMFNGSEMSVSSGSNMISIIPGTGIVFYRSNGTTRTIKWTGSDV